MVMLTKCGFIKQLLTAQLEVSFYSYRLGQILSLCVSEDHGDNFLKLKYLKDST